MLHFGHDLGFEVAALGLVEVRFLESAAGTAELLEVGAVKEARLVD